NSDGRTDILLLGAVVRGGQIGDLLLRNDGDWHFTDVTALTGLAGERSSLGCVVADFDNDGQSDLFFTCVGSNRLFLNVGGAFKDVTKSVGIQSEPLISLGATALDLDQDGDLDLYVTNYARLDDVATAFTSQFPPEVPNVVYRNDSKARAVAADEAAQG